MNELRILGDVDLRGTDGDRVDSIVAQPKRLALLAYLVLATPGGSQQRDLLISVFWPELAESNARNSLNQSLHRLRQALGAETLISQGTNEVGIDPGELSCDALEFADAIEAGELERALDLYRGDLLKGLFVSGSPEFERWLDTERAMLRRKAFDSAMTMGRGAEDTDDLVSAARWYRRAMAIIPERGTAVRKLMEVLARAGNPAEALQVFDRFAARLEEDYGVQPSDETRAVLESIRSSLSGDGSQLPEEHTSARGVISGEALVSRIVGTAEGERSGRSVWKRRATVLAAVLVLLPLGMAGVWSLSRGDDGGGSQSLRVAVLPFENIGDDPESAYLADGLHNEILTRLHLMGALKVISRTSVLEYRATGKSLKTIAEELGVQTVMEASVQRSGDRVRINAQLIDARTDEHLWANIYDRELTAGNLFDVQGSIALDVARALSVDLSADAEAATAIAPTDNLQAYEFYLRGKSFFNGFFGQTEEAVEMFENAVRLDSNFGSAYAWLSQARSNQYNFQSLATEELAESARDAAQRALELSPELPETHMALGTYHYYVRNDYSRALEEYEIALESWPSNARLFLMTGAVKRRRGDFLAARDDLARAAELDRHFALAGAELAQTDRFLRDYATAERHYLEVIATNPDLGPAYIGLTMLYIAWTGRTDRARAVLEEFPGGRTGEDQFSMRWFDVERLDREYQVALDRLDEGPDILEWLGHFYPRSLLAADMHALMGRPELARTSYDSARVVIESWLRENPDDPRAHGALGIALAGLGRDAEAVREGRMAVDLLPLSKDALIGTWHLEALARIYVMVGEYDATIDELEVLLSRPGPLSVARLRLDPTWDPLRDHPRFQALVVRGDQ